MRRNMRPGQGTIHEATLLGIRELEGTRLSELHLTDSPQKSGSICLGNKISPLRVYRTLNKNCVPTTVTSALSECYGWRCWDRESENVIMNWRLKFSQEAEYLQLNDLFRFCHRLIPVRKSHLNTCNQVSTKVLSFKPTVLTKISQEEKSREKDSFPTWHQDCSGSRTLCSGLSNRDRVAWDFLKPL